MGTFRSMASYRGAASREWAEKRGTKKSASPRLLYLAAFFCVSLVVSNVIGGKLYQAPFGIVLPAGVWLFPIVYIIGDVVPEVYGIAAARRVIALGFLTNAFAVLFFYLTVWLPSPGFWPHQSQFEAVLGLTPRLLAASLVAYVAGSNVNAQVLVVIKRLTRSRWLWMRTIGSTICGEAVDSCLFVSVAFLGIVPRDQLLWMILWQATFKIAYEIVATPFTYWIVSFFKQREGLVDTLEGLSVPKDQVGETSAGLATAGQA
jgi:queuosine precursor transporter